MTTLHAVLWLDHQRAQILQFDAEHVAASTVKAHNHQTRQHGSGVRTEHEFFAAVCDGLAGIAEVLVTGSQQALADLQHYLQKHRPQLVARVVGYETVDHPSDRQLVAMARKYFLRHDRMSGSPTPS